MNSLSRTAQTRGDETYFWAKKMMASVSLGSLVDSILSDWLSAGRATGGGWGSTALRLGGLSVFRQGLHHAGSDTTVTVAHLGCVY